MKVVNRINGKLKIDNLGIYHIENFYKDCRNVKEVMELMDELIITIKSSAYVKIEKLKEEV